MLLLAPYGRSAAIKDYPPPPHGVKNALQIMSLAAYASETNNIIFDMHNFSHILLGLIQ